MFEYRFLRDEGRRARPGYPDAVEFQHPLTDEKVVVRRVKPRNQITEKDIPEFALRHGVDPAIVACDKVIYDCDDRRL